MQAHEEVGSRNKQPSKLKSSLSSRSVETLFRKKECHSLSQFSHRGLPSGQGKKSSRCQVNVPPAILRKSTDISRISLYAETKIEHARGFEMQPCTLAIRWFPSLQNTANVSNHMYHHDLESD